MTIKHFTSPAKSGPPPDRPRAPAPPPPPKWRSWVLLAGFAITLLLLFLPTVHSTPTSNFTYTQFLNEVRTNKIKTASINPTGGVSGTLSNKNDYTTQIPTALVTNNSPLEFL